MAELKDLQEKYPDEQIYSDEKGHYTKHSLLEGIQKFVSIGFGSYGMNGSWWSCVCAMGAWYQNNVHTYQGTTAKGQPLKNKNWYDCPLIGGKVADDCSGFVKACLQAFGVPGIDPIWVTTAQMQPGSKFDQTIQAAGFVRGTYNYASLAPGDIICGGPSTHTEIYCGKENGRDRVYSWGNIHDGVSPRGNCQGMPCAMSKMNYLHVWRKM